MSDRATSLNKNPSSQMIEVLDKLGIIDAPTLRENLAKLQSQQKAIRPAKKLGINAPNSPAVTADIKRLEKDNDSLAAHAEMLACAVGACPICWGLDTDCMKCAGAGKSGFFLPDEICFREFVLPVINRILGQSKTPAQNLNGAQPITNSGEKHDRI